MEEKENLPSELPSLEENTVEEEVEAVEDQLLLTREEILEMHLFPKCLEKFLLLLVEEQDLDKPVELLAFFWYFMTFAYTVVVVLVGTVFFRFQHTLGESMAPTIGEEEVCVIWRFCYTPKQGDVISFLVNLQQFGELEEMEGMAFFGKRIIATEGQSLVMDYENNCIWVDGDLLEEEYLPENLLMEPVWEECDYPYVVPMGEVFVMGDNRNASTDSRWRGMGAVPVERILGKVIFVFPDS